ncbi:MAG: DUF349 domain-containing protein [Cyclobacteriaceae bacterium]
MAKKEIPYGYIEDDKIHLKAYLDFSDRVIGEVKEDDEDASVQYFINRFDQFKEKVSDLERLIEESENKGSFLMKLRHMLDSVGQHDGLGDYVPLINRMKEVEASLNEIISQNRQRNTEIKRALMLELEEALKVADWKASTELVLDIKSRWVKTGNALEEFQEGFEERFAYLLNDFFERKKEFYEERRKLIDIRVQKYTDLIDRAYQSKPDELSAIQEEWREVGKVPSIKFKELQMKFSRAVKKAGYSRTERPYASPEEQQQNYEQKQAIIQQLKDYNLTVTDDTADEVKQLKSKWRQIGNVPREVYRPQQEEFSTLSDMLLELSFVKRLAENRDEGYEQKNSREQVRVQMKLLRDLLSRDERELQTYYDNASNFQSQRGNFGKMVDQKLVQQKHKVQVKKGLLRKMKQSLDTI